MSTKPKVNHKQFADMLACPSCNAKAQQLVLNMAIVKQMYAEIHAHVEEGHKTQDD